ncbi:MAG: hypothetical protein ACOC3J_07115 [Gemmatimonadota bacterium]
MKKLSLLVGLAALGLTACEDAIGPGTALTADEMTGLSDAMIAEAYAITGDYAAQAMTAADPEGAASGIVADVTATTDFTITRTCPAGGEIVVEGTRVRVRDPETRSGSMDLDMTKTHDACARQVRRATVTLTGQPHIAVVAHHGWEDGVLAGLQTLSLDGGFAWTSDDDRSGECVVDLDVQFDPDARTRTVSGTFCNRTIDATTTWTS